MALLEIRDRRLYRQAGFKTFEAYCRTPETAPVQARAHPPPSP
jgi:hypothetical protein